MYNKMCSLIGFTAFILKSSDCQPLIPLQASEDRATGHHVSWSLTCSRPPFHWGQSWTVHVKLLSTWVIRSSCFQSTDECTCNMWQRNTTSAIHPQLTMTHFCLSISPNNLMSFSWFEPSRLLFIRCLSLECWNKHCLINFYWQLCVYGSRVIQCIPTMNSKEFLPGK